MGEINVIIWSNRRGAGSGSFMSPLHVIPSIQPRLNSLGSPDHSNYLGSPYWLVLPSFQIGICIRKWCFTEIKWGDFIFTWMRRRVNREGKIGKRGQERERENYFLVHGKEKWHILISDTHRCNILQVSR